MQIHIFRETRVIWKLETRWKKKDSCFKRPRRHHNLDFFLISRVSIMYFTLEETFTARYMITIIAERNRTICITSKNDLRIRDTWRAIDFRDTRPFTVSRQKGRRGWKRSSVAKLSAPIAASWIVWKGGPRSLFAERSGLQTSLCFTGIMDEAVNGGRAYGLLSRHCNARLVFHKSGSAELLKFFPRLSRGNRSLPPPCLPP